MTTVALLGDSQAGGLRGPLAAELERRGWTPTRYEYQNGASSRKLIDDGHLERALEARPDVLIVAAGGNDSTISQRTWEEIVRMARAVGARVFWMGPPASTDPDRDQTRRAISIAQRAAVQGAGGTWIDGRELARGLPYADTVHFTAAGYEGLASRLAARVTSGPSLIGLGVAGLVAGGLLAWYAGRNARVYASGRTRTRASGRTRTRART